MSGLETLYGSGWILALLLVLPMIGAGLCLAVSEERAAPAALTTALAALALGLPLFWTFETGTAAFQNTASVPWIEAWGISFTVGIDGISILMVLLTLLTVPLAIAASVRYIDRHRNAYYALMLLLGAGMLGVFVSLDLFLFYVFWEIMLIPMYFIIGIWGGERRIYSAIKFFLFTAVGSLLMLVAIVGVVYLHWEQTGAITFAYGDLLGTTISGSTQMWLFAAFAAAFAIKVPLFPVHTWLPDAHVQAPTAGSVILAGVLLKMGTYGFLRFAMPLFPQAAVSSAVVGTILALSLVGVLYAAWVAAVQPDAKKLIAYTSIAHLGFVMLGIFALNSEGMQGGLLQMLNHGISTAGLFLLVGMLYERRHTRLIADFGGIARVMPFFAFSLVVVGLSSIGLPGTNGFVGEFLILVGTFRSHPVVAAVATTGVIFAAYYMLPMLQRVLFNSLAREENRALTDLTTRERAIMTPLLVLIVLIGVHPTPFLDRIGPSVDALVERLEEPASPSGAADFARRLAPPSGGPGEARRVEGAPAGLRLAADGDPYAPGEGRGR